MGLQKRNLAVSRPKNLPGVIDLTDYRSAVHDCSLKGKKYIAATANCYRYGNRDKSELRPEILQKTTDYLSQYKGRQIQEDEISVVAVGDFVKSRFVYKIPSYYDYDTQESIIFTEAGEPNFKMVYERNLFGNISSFEISAVYDNKTKEWLKR